MQRRKKSLLVKQELLDYRKQVSGGAALLLVQGYPFSGFLLIDHSGRLSLPPMADLEEADAFADWRLFWNLRLFGPLGEWHLWREEDGSWGGRLAQADDPAWKDPIVRCDLLWGLPDGEGDRDGLTWTRYQEARGVGVWIPGENREPKRPACLRLWQRVAYEDTSGLAGVADAMLRGIETAEEKHA